MADEQRYPRIFRGVFLSRKEGFSAAIKSRKLEVFEKQRREVHSFDDLNFSSFLYSLLIEKRGLTLRLNPHEPGPRRALPELRKEPCEVVDVCFCGQQHRTDLMGAHLLLYFFDAACILCRRETAGRGHAT